jgi:uncharacterized protein (TIGR03083 family)
MDDAARIDAVEGELAALVAAVAGGPPDGRVPTCPDFSLDDLAAHVGQFCGFWAHVLCEATGRPKPAYSTEVAPGGRVGWLQEQAQALVRELRATPPDTEAWTWHPTDHTARFVARRCSHELAVHRVDAQLAGGGPVEAVAPALAADGIDEVFTLMAHSPGRTAMVAVAGARRGQTLHLHGTDFEPAEWLVTFDPGGVRVESAHARGDLAVRGAVSDLEMLLYQRPTQGPIERFGDGSVLDLFHAEFTFT